MNSAGIEQSRILDPKGYMLGFKGVFFKNRNMEGFFGAQKLIKGIKAPKNLSYSRPLF